MNELGMFELKNDNIRPLNFIDKYILYLLFIDTFNSFLKLL